MIEGISSVHRCQMVKLSKSVFRNPYGVKAGKSVSAVKNGKLSCHTGKSAGFPVGRVIACDSDGNVLVIFDDGFFLHGHGA